MPRYPKIKSDVYHITQNICLQGDLGLSEPMSVLELSSPILLSLHQEIPTEFPVATAKRGRQGKSHALFGKSKICVSGKLQLFKPTSLQV